MASPIKPVRGQAGTFVVAGTNTVIKLVEWREDNVYDTVELAPTGTLTPTAGATYEFFDSLANKKKRDTNLNKAHALPAGWELIITKMGCYFQLAAGNNLQTPADAKKFYENYSVVAKINDTPIADGWVLGYQTGIGLYGQTTENAQGVIAPGTPSIGAAPTLLVPQEVNDSHDIRATLYADSMSWSTTNPAQPTFSSAPGFCKFIFRGFLKRPLSKG